MIIRDALKGDRFILWVAQKSNCTNITKMFFEHLGILGEALSISEWVHKYRWNKYVPEHVTNLEDLKNTEYIRIKFIRCPYDRAISCYLHVVKVKYYKHPLLSEFGNLKDKSFVGFLEQLEKDGCERYHTSPNPHVQSQFFREEKSFKWDEIIEIENLDNEIDRINEKYGFKFNADQGTSFHWSKPDNDYYPFKSYLDFMNDEVKCLIEKVYKIDLDNSDYNYSKFIQRNIRINACEGK